MTNEQLSSLKNSLVALIRNIIAWFQSFLRQKTTKLDISDDIDTCISIKRPGGVDELISTKMTSDNNIISTVGYNVKSFPPPYVRYKDFDIETDPTLVLIKIKYFSINYADICIRWGLYESALKYVGYPIVPGFDFSGIVEQAGSKSNYSIGDQVFGFTLFGSYSTKLLVPATQIRKISAVSKVSLEDYAAYPAVAATALHAISLAGGWPNKPITKNKAALIHSAAGGVGTMLIQMCKLQGYSPIVAVVSNDSKIDICQRLGADYVINKNKVNLWQTAKKLSSDLYVTIFDPNGVETLQDSYNHLSQCGKLIIYGFHTNLPKNSNYLSPYHWCNMIYGMIQMPKFDPMIMVLQSKSIHGFNLSFFADETELIASYMKQLVIWLENGNIKITDSTLFDIKDIRLAHEYIQSGKSKGKLIIRTNM